MDETSREAIGARMRQAQVQSGKRVIVLAERLGVTDRAVYAWFEGRNQPELIMLGQFAQETGVSVSWLMTGADETVETLLRWLRLVAADVRGDHAADQAIPTLATDPLTEGERDLIRTMAPALLQYLSDRVGSDWHRKTDRELLPHVLRLVESLRRPAP